MYGVTVAPGGDVIACDFGQGRSSASVQPARHDRDDGNAGSPLRVPNFAAFDAAGNLYVTDSGARGADDGIVLRITTDARPRSGVSTCLRSPTAAAERRRSLSLVVESRARRVVAVPIADDGSAGCPRGWQRT